MQVVNIHEAKTHLSRLIERAGKGEPFIIAKAGKPLVIVKAVDAPPGDEMSRLGFLVGHIAVPDDFDRMGKPKSNYSSASGETAARYACAAMGRRAARSIAATS